MSFTVRLAIVAALATVLTGCEQYVALHDTADRIWIMSKDGSSVLRCMDLTPDQKPFVGNARVFCKAAYIYGTVTPVPVDSTATATTPAPSKPQPQNPIEGEMK